MGRKQSCSKHQGEEGNKDSATSEGPSPPMTLECSSCDCRLLVCQKHAELHQSINFWMTFHCEQCKRESQMPDETENLPEEDEAQDEHILEWDRSPEDKDSAFAQSEIQEILEWDRSPADEDYASAQSETKEILEWDRSPEDRDSASAEPETQKQEAAAQQTPSRLSTSDPPQVTSTLRKCLQCNQVFFSRKTFKEHLKSTHPVEISFECPICAKNYSTNQQFLAHGWKDHNTDITGFPECEKCGNKFRDQSELWIHTKFRHSDEDKKNGNGSGNPEKKN